jgi:predicted dehydrogenase
MNRTTVPQPISQNSSGCHPAPLRVGLAGLGYAGATLHAPLITATPGLDLVAVASHNPLRVEATLGPQVQVMPQAEDLARWPGIDLLVIATPNDTHAALAEAALRAGKHVVVDKPFALSAEQAAPLLHLAQQAGCLLSVFHNRRWDADFLTAQDLLAQGTLGRITEARLHFDRFRPVVRERWREGAGPGAGLWSDLAPHLLDQALQLFGWPESLQTDLMTLRDGGLSDDAFECRLRYANGLRVTLGASMLTALPGPRFALHGTLGSWVKHGLDTQEDALKAGLRPDLTQPQAWGIDPQCGQLALLQGDGTVQATLHANLNGRWPTFYAALRDAIRGRGQNPVPADGALRVLMLQDLGRVSAAQRREMAVNHTPMNAQQESTT